MAFQIERTAEVQLPPTMSTEEAVDMLRQAGMKISRETLRCGIQQKVFPFGDCVEAEKSPVFFIYRLPLERWILERFGEAET